MRLQSRASLTTGRKSEVVVITGASAGVGRATVREFAKRGASIGLLARGEERLRASAEEVAEAGGRALVVPTDVASADQVEAAAQKVEDAFGPIEIWINNAMTTVFARLVDIRPEEFRRVIDVSLNGTVWGTMAALRRMAPRNRGTILQVGSALAYRAIPLQSAYCAAKHGVEAITTSLRSELIHDGINVYLTIVHLPGMNTPQFSWCESRMPREAQPVPPIFEPEIAARAIYWAAHHRRREVFVVADHENCLWKYARPCAPRYISSKGSGRRAANDSARHAAPIELVRTRARGVRGAWRV